jgi:GNAT superfamily N-acetyltransferase
MEAQVVVLSERHRSALERFSCSDVLLDSYLQCFALQDQQALKSICLLLVNQEKDIVGYVTLGTSTLEATHLHFNTLNITKSPNRHHPIVVIKRLAIGVQFQGKGFGRHLLIAALKQAFISSRSIGASAVFVNQIDGIPTTFYKKLGFIELPNQQKLFLPMQQLHAMFFPFH